MPPPLRQVKVCDIVSILRARGDVMLQKGGRTVVGAAMRQGHAAVAD